MREADVEAIGLLQDPRRRALYEYVVGQGRCDAFTFRQPFEPPVPAAR